jgi:hypothetical protein
MVAISRSWHAPGDFIATMGRSNILLMRTREHLYRNIQPEFE